MVAARWARSSAIYAGKMTDANGQTIYQPAKDDMLVGWHT